MSWLLNLTEDAAVGERGRSFVFLKKDVYKKEGYCEVQSTQTSQPAEVVSAVMLALDGWHFLSLSLSQRWREKWENAAVRNNSRSPAAMLSPQAASESSPGRGQSLSGRAQSLSES